MSVMRVKESHRIMNIAEKQHEKSTYEMILRITLIFIAALVFSQCESQNSSSQPTGYNIAIFKNTEGYELARAIQQNSVRKIKKILDQKPDLINFQEPVYGQSVLKWAVRMEKYEAAKTLLESGANPDRQSFNGWSPMTEAASNLFTTKYLELLIEFGADVNAVSVETTGRNPFINCWTPLMFAISSFDNVKILIANGADVNYLHDLKKTTWNTAYQFQTDALYCATHRSYVRTARYLIIECGADFTRPYRLHPVNSDTLYYVNELRHLKYPIGSEKHQLKMEIVEYMRERGVNYWETPIGEHLTKQLIEKYGEEYLEKY